VIVEKGPVEALCRQLIEEWALFIARGIPFIRIKAAVSVDGRIATAAGDSRWISSEVSRKEVHRMRARHDAVLVGLDTVVRDDPMLTVRGVAWKGDPPWRIVADTHLRIPLHSKLVQTAAQVPTFIACGADVKKEVLKKHGVQTLHCSLADGRVDLEDMVRKLGRLSITSVLVEGGGQIITSLIEKRLADAITLYICPIIVGGKHAVPLVRGKGVDAIRDALRIRDVSWRKRGDEIVLSGRL